MTGGRTAAPAGQIAGAAVVRSAGGPLAQAAAQAAVQVALGTALALPFQEAMKPTEVVAPAAMAPFQATFFTVTAAPLWVNVPFHDWEMTCPLANVKVTVQAEMAAVEVFFTVIPPWKPPSHWFWTR